MEYNFYVTNKERVYLRELAAKYMEYANLPIMEERKKLWYAHNSLHGDRPVIVMEMGTFEGDILPSPKCESPAAIEIEKQLMRSIVNHEMIDDDKVIAPYYTVYWKINIKQFGMDIKKEFAKDSKGKNVGYIQQHPIADLQADLSKVKPSIYNVDREYTLVWKNFVEEVIGDILPVKIKNNSLFWHVTPTAKVIDLMGMETMMYSMIDYPDEMHELMKFIRDDIIAYIKWQEKEGLLTLNNENDYAGAGSYGFTTELPSQASKEQGVVTTRDLWVNMNSQESVGISPDMYGEFIFPYYYDLAKEFGLVYYGCCEPVHDVWKDYVSKIPNLRKVSISPWCDENIMGEMLRGSNVMYSRKPSPNFIGVDTNFDEDGFREHISKTLMASKGCHVEFIFRDVYTLLGDSSRPGRAVKIVREQIGKLL